MRDPKYSISILAHNQITRTTLCLLSVVANSHGQDYELILTDNGSTDGIKELFGSIPKARVITRDHNDGFIRPNNEALKLARGEFFVCLNNDTEVPPRWLETLFQPFRFDAQVALVGVAGGCNHLTDTFCGFPSSDPEYVEGACMMARTEIVRQHGLFSEYLDFAYCEDSDLSLRMRQLGYRIREVDMPGFLHHRFSTARGIPGLGKIAEKNRATCCNVWAEYLKTRKFP